MNDQFLLMATPAWTWLWMGVYHAAAMLWETLWALVLGFGISAALQIFVSKDRMTRLLGRAGLSEILLAIGFGAASSSCSYAAASIGRSAFQKGAALVPALAFMFASTNLVIELGAVLWLLMGWKFLLAETVGSFVLIGVMWLLMSIFFPRKLEEEARQHSTTEEEHCCHGGHSASHSNGVTSDHPQKWGRLANAFWADWLMLWKELAAGFLIAGFLAALVPPDWWKALFIETGAPMLRLIENAAVGPIIAILSFVCSVGNIPLASLLWENGISFGGVIAFIYADLLVIPLILIYRKYFGGRATFYIVIIFYASMVVAGIVVDLLFAALNLIPQGQRPLSPIEHATFSWNYTTWLDFVAIGVALGLWALKMRSDRAV
ncbi:MAG TPA: permease [Chthoniobacterales bacterium]|nr:permease [Chthoniobacterales bacterium]